MNRLIATGAALGVVALMIATYILGSRPGDDPFAQCGGSAIAGGSVGGPFSLIDGEGNAVTDTDVLTSPSLVYFGYTFCPDVCPLDNARNALAVDVLEESGADAQPVFISIDPDRDTPDVMRDYAFNVHSRMVALTGTPEQVAAAARAYRVYYKKQDGDPDYYLVDHSTFTYLALPGIGVVDFFRRDDSPEVVADRTECAIEVAAAN